MTAGIVVAASIWHFKVLYFTFKQQINSKDSTIEMLRERISSLESNSPDALLDKLGKRATTFDDEMKRVDKDMEKLEADASRNEADLKEAHGEDKEKLVTEIDRLTQESERSNDERESLIKNFELETKRLAMKLKGVEQSMTAFHDLEIGFLPDADPEKCTQEILQIMKPRLFEQFEMLDFEQVAVILQTSTQTLRRSLASEGTSYQTLKDVLRQELAEQLLKDGRDAKTVSACVGFNDAPTFYRAFKKWTGNTPAEFQKRL